MTDSFSLINLSRIINWITFFQVRQENSAEQDKNKYKAIKQLQR